MPSLSSVIIQPRDLEILRGLFESRILTLRHIASFYFDGSIEAAKKRIQKLKSCGLIGEQRHHVNEPAMMFLRRAGWDMLKEEGVLQEYKDVSAVSFQKRTQVSPLTRKHELEVLDVKSAFIQSLRSSKEFTVAQFCTWTSLHSFKAAAPKESGYVQEREIFPDGFIHVKRTNGEGEFFFFLEVDRSNESQDIIATKASCYLDYYKRGGFALRRGATREQFANFPFRVLIVCKNKERRNNAAARMLTFLSPILRHAWLTTLDECLENFLGSIWICPVDYAEATKDTPFDPYVSQSSGVYRRQTQREDLVEKMIVKRSIFS